MPPLDQHETQRGGAGNAEGMGDIIVRSGWCHARTFAAGAYGVFGSRMLLEML